MFGRRARASAIRMNIFVVFESFIIPGYPNAPYPSQVPYTLLLLFLDRFYLDMSFDRS